MSAVVTLLTDFGLRDPWVAEVKGALHAAWARHPGRASAPAIIDLGHEVPPGDVAAASWFLERAAACFPAGTVHLAVVDPGVGSSRPAVACRARDQIFVGPGNGLLAFLLADLDGPGCVVRLEELCGRGHPRTGRVSATFHGRDLFAPAAARLALGEPLGLLGPAAGPDALGRLPGQPAGLRLLWVDRFGNGISNLDEAGEPARRLASGGRLRVAGREVPGPFTCYAEAAPGAPFWYWGSGGTLEIAVAGGSAAEALGLRPGLALEISNP